MFESLHVPLLGILDYLKSIVNHIKLVHITFFKFTIVLCGIVSLNVENIQEYFVEYCSSHRTLLWN